MTLPSCKLKATGMPLWEFRELAVAKHKRKRRSNQNIRRRLKQQDRREWDEPFTNKGGSGGF